MMVFIVSALSASEVYIAVKGDAKEGGYDEGMICSFEKGFTDLFFDNGYIVISDGEEKGFSEEEVKKSAQYLNADMAILALVSFDRSQGKREAVCRYSCCYIGEDKRLSPGIFKKSFEGRNEPDRYFFADFGKSAAEMIIKAIKK